MAIKPPSVEESQHPHLRATTTAAPRGDGIMAQEAARAAAGPGAVPREEEREEEMEEVGEDDIMAQATTREE